MTEQKNNSSRKRIVIGALALLVVVVAGFKLSLVSLGDVGDGSYALVWKSGSLSELRPIDSDRDACKRLVGSTSWTCTGALAIAIQNQGAALLRWSR